MPVLVYPDVRAAVSFLTAPFGFVERTRVGDGHRAQMAIGGDGAVIIADVGADRRAPDTLGVTHLVRVRVADVDDAFARAVDHGTAVLEAPVEAVAHVAPEEFGCQTVSPWPAYQSPTDS